MGHTPGPWKVVDRFYIWTDDDVGCEVAKVCDENLDDDCLPQADADARLIAAAPELLAACRSLVDEIDSWVWVNVGGKVRAFEVSGGYAAYLQNLVRAAIAKAEGRSE